MKKIISLMFLVVILLGVAYAEEGTTMYVCVDEDSYLNGREKPDKDSEIICFFYNGDEVNVLEIVGDWAKVDEGGEDLYSYVWIDYLTSKMIDDEPRIVSANGRVRVRDEPNGELVGDIHDGDVVIVEAWRDEWARIANGWVLGEFLD